MPKIKHLNHEEHEDTRSKTKNLKTTEEK